MEELKERFPEGLDYAIVYDTTPFITESVNEVFKTLRDAVILVAMVVLLFLQNWRSALIPLVAVPVAIVGTFAVMAALGFSLNNLTLFGLVLAIGIVVDDAIVVVEAVEHHIEHGMAPRDATVRAMDEVSGPVIAIGLVLTAVFVPCAFITGIVGQFFRQFALTIADLDADLGVQLADPQPRPRRPPAQAASRGRSPRPCPGWPMPWPAAWLGYVFLRPAARPGRLGAGPGRGRPTAIAAVVGAVVGLGRRLADRPGPGLVLRRLQRRLHGGHRRLYPDRRACCSGEPRSSCLIYGGLLYLTYYAFDQTPTGFIPSQDKGYLLVNVQMPDSTSVEHTQQVMQRVEEIARQDRRASSTPWRSPASRSCSTPTPRTSARCT